MTKNKFSVQENQNLISAVVQIGRSLLTIQQTIKDHPLEGKLIGFLIDLSETMKQFSKAMVEIQEEKHD